MERLVDAVTPLGDALWFRQMKGTEALSSLFEYEVLLHGRDSGLSAKAMLGKPITLKLETAGGGERYFNGLCTRFRAAGREGEQHLYTARMHPWLWLAGRRSDCKIFQFMKVPDIVSDVLGKYGSPLELRLRKSYREWEYCVQYQETDLNFVMRLMEHEGIYFFFEHQANNHTLVLIDDIGSHAPLPGKPSIKYFGVDAGTVATEEHFNSWEVCEDVASGEYLSDDYDFEKPRADLKTRRQQPMGHSHDPWERYTWPGGYMQLDDGESYAETRLEALQADRERTLGHTTVRTMAPGYLFSLERCPRADQNREYLAVGLTYYLRDNTRMAVGGGGEGDSDWRFETTAQPTSLPYRPPQVTPKPRAHGLQTAVVVGPPGEEIYTDQYGRVKVQFFWDRYGQRNEHSSCWMRVASPWAGEKWGFIQIPRIGQEVVVDFIDGDPDHPLITGRVYNADQMPPYGLPANKTASGFKSRSTQGGSAVDFNEIRMEDLKGKEQFYLHAQRNFDSVVELNESRVIGNDRQTRVGHNDDRFVANDCRTVVAANQTLQVQAHQSTAVAGSQSLSVLGNQSNMVKGKRTQSVGGNLAEKTGGDHRESVGGKHTITVGGDEKNNIGGTQLNFVQGGRKSVVAGKEVVTSTGKTTHFAAAGYGVLTPLKYSVSCLNRQVNVDATDRTTVVGTQTLTVGGSRSSTIGISDSTTVGASHTVEVGASSSLTAGASVTILAGGAVSVTGGAAVTVTGSTVTITAATINLVGIVNIAGMLNVAGTIVTPSIVSATYTPGVGNLI